LFSRPLPAAAFGEFVLRAVPAVVQS